MGKFQVGDWVLFTVSNEQDIGKITKIINRKYEVTFFGSFETTNRFDSTYFRQNKVRKLSQDEVIFYLLER